MNIYVYIYTYIYIDIYMAPARAPAASLAMPALLFPSGLPAPTPSAQVVSLVFS